MFPSAVAETGEITVEGRVKDDIPHLTMVGSFQVDASLERSIILCSQVDHLGMIDAVGSVLGEQNVTKPFSV
jgi:D-3-phosphoglycerate dehydrogenase / 2-oxoglutarate reductase